MIAAEDEAATESAQPITEIEEQSGKTDLDNVIAGLERFEELESAAAKFWQELDDAVVKPRTDLRHDHRVPSIETKNVRTAPTLYDLICG